MLIAHSLARSGVEPFGDERWRYWPPSPRTTLSGWAVAPTRVTPRSTAVPTRSLADRRRGAGLRAESCTIRETRIVRLGRVTPPREACAGPDRALTDAELLTLHHAERVRMVAVVRCGQSRRFFAMTADVLRRRATSRRLGRGGGAELSFRGAVGRWAAPVRLSSSWTSVAVSAADRAGRARNWCQLLGGHRMRIRLTERCCTPTRHVARRCHGRRLVRRARKPPAVPGLARTWVWLEADHTVPTALAQS